MKKKITFSILLAAASKYLQTHRHNFKYMQNSANDKNDQRNGIKSKI